MMLFTLPFQVPSKNRLDNSTVKYYIQVNIFQPICYFPSFSDLIFHTIEVYLLDVVIQPTPRNSHYDLRFTNFRELTLFGRLKENFYTPLIRSFIKSYPTVLRWPFLVSSYLYFSIFRFFHPPLYLQFVLELFAYSFPDAVHNPLQRGISVFTVL